MTAIAYINRTDPLRRGIEVWVGDQTDAGITQWFPDGTRKFVPNGEYDEMAVPSFRMDELHARALLEVLLNYYQGGDDTRALRKDYDAERVRVDKMIDALSRSVIQ